MALLFHQNMENYDMGYVRNIAYKKAFGTIQGKTGPRYWAAGFTELLASSGRLVESLSEVAQTLDEGLKSILVIAVGRSGSGARSEYIGISWDHTSGVTVDYAGTVLLNTYSKWTVHNAAVAAATKDKPVADTISMPRDGWKADSRGVAYIACRSVSSANRYIIGFFHNEFGHGDRSGAYASMSTIADNMRATVGIADNSYANATVIIGGDFNVTPPESASEGKGERTKKLRSESKMKAFAATDGEGDLINTTESSVYDFWLSTYDYSRAGRAGVYTETRKHPMSKHAAITFKV
jgi:hypothetical protein